MKPIDFRNATWQEIQGKLSGQRRLIYEAWLLHGPCTTRELAHKSGLSILTVRPRTTELFQLMLLDLTGDKDGHEGRYHAVHVDVARQRFENSAEKKPNEQPFLNV